jgi:hypothetical protein
MSLASICLARYPLSFYEEHRIPKSSSHLSIYIAASPRLFRSAMPPTNGDKRTTGSSPVPEIKAKSPQYKKLVTPMSTQNPELRTDTKSKRRRRKGNNWTRKKHAPRSPAQSSGVSPTSSPETKQDEFKNHEGLEVKSSETLGNMPAGKC